MSIVTRMLQPHQEERTYHWLRDHVLAPSETDESPRITLLAAYATWSGITNIADDIRTLKEVNPQAQLRAIIGSNGDQLTTQEALMLLLELCDEVYIVALRSDTFHPKGYLRQCGDDAVLIEGSPNLTSPALFTNSEWVTRTEFNLAEEDGADAVEWAHICAQADACIDPEQPEIAPVGLGSPDNMDGGVWIMKQGGVVNMANLDSVMPRLQTDAVARAANSANRKNRRQTGAGQTGWGAGRRPRSNTTPSNLRPSDYRWQPEPEVEGEDESQQPNLAVLTVVEMVEIIVVELREPVATRDNTLIWSTAEAMLAELDAQSHLNNDTPAPDTATVVASWKRLSNKDRNHSTEMQGYTRSLQNITRLPGEISFQTIYLIRNRTTSPNGDESQVYAPDSGQGRTNDFRMRHHCRAAFSQTAMAGDILVMIPLRELNAATPITEAMESLQDSDPDCIGIILPSDSSHGERLLELVDDSRISGYLLLPTVEI